MGMRWAGRGNRRGDGRGGDGRGGDGRGGEADKITSLTHDCGLLFEGNTRLQRASTPN